MLPENATAWYNALPNLLHQKSVALYASDPREFYSKENVLFLPGAQYPDSDRRLARPLFAIAINTKLQRKKDGPEKSVKIQQIANPSRTVLFLEQGLKGEKKAMPQQPAYDSSPKGCAKSFVARYNGLPRWPRRGGGRQGDPRRERHVQMAGAAGRRHLGTVHRERRQSKLIG